MTRRAVLFILISTILVVFGACKKINSHNAEKTHKNKIHLVNNKFFYNHTLKKILFYHNQQDIDHIINFLNDTLPLARYYALLSLSSLNDTSHLYLKINMLDDTSSLVRQAAAFSIGLQHSKNAQDILIKHYYNEPDTSVRAQILEAIGKCGTSNTLYFLSNISVSSQTEQNGLAWGLVHFAIRGIVTKTSTKKAFNLLTNYNSSKQTKRIISQFFYQPNVNISQFYKQLIHIYNNTEDTILKLNIIKALSRINNKQIFDFLYNNLLDSNSLIQIEAAKALTHLNFPEIPSLMVQLTHSNNTKVAQIAANYFIQHGQEKESNYYFELAKTIKNWQPRSLMLHAAIKYAPDSVKEKFANSVISGFKATKNFYEKSFLLSSMAFYPQKYEFVRNQAFYASHRIITTTAARTLLKMRLQPNFNSIAQNYYKQQGFDLNKEFGLIFKELFKKGDYAQIYYASIALKNKKLHLLQDYENTFFINQALAKLQLPRDIKIYHSLCKIYLIYTGDTCAKPIFNMSEIDWPLAQKIANKTKVKIKTTKGDFIIELYPGKAPATVSTFLKLVTQGYYNNTYIYRVLPNTSIWISSRRGDQWPDVNIAHPVLLSPEHVEPGSIAMNLIDNGIESVQWFIILNPTPGMNDHYTTFGKIIKGMKNVQKLEVGDKIIAIEIF